MHVNESIDRGVDRYCIYNRGEGWINAYLMCKEAGMLGQGCSTRAAGEVGELEDGGLLNNWRFHLLFTQH